MEFKKKITLSLSLLVCTGSVIFTNNVYACEQISEMSDIQYLEKLSSEIKRFIDAVTMVINKLKDDKDTMSFAQCVAFMDAKLDDMQKNFVVPLKERLAKHQYQSSMHYKALKAADNVLAILHTQFQKLSKAMKDPANKQTGLKMAMALKNQMDAFFGQHAALDNAMAELHRCLAILQLDTLVKEIAVVRAAFQKAKEENDKPSTAEDKAKQAKLVNALHKKLKK